MKSRALVSPPNLHPPWVGSYTDRLLISNLSWICKIKLMEGVCHLLQGSQNPSYPSVRLSIWLSICKALRQTKDYVIFFFSPRSSLFLCYIAGNFFPTVRSLIGYFEITWHLAIDTAAILNQLDLRGIMGCPGGHLARSDIHTQYLGALFGSIFLKVFLEKDWNGKKDRHTVFGFNNDCILPEKYSIFPKSARHWESARWASYNTP